MKKIALLFLGAFAAVILMGIFVVATKNQMPMFEGLCSKTTIDKLETRLEDGDGKSIPDSGHTIAFANGGYQVSYDMNSAVQNSHSGDAVMICLISIPEGCPSGDDRGRLYTTTNLRTGESWTMPDAEHMCGGA